MTDAEYIFRTDAAEKKRTGRSVQKKNRTGKGAVRFPSDYMTRKERTAMNGEIKTYNLNAPMTYAVFKSMPEDLQREYLKKLDSFNVPSSDIAEMLGAGLSTLYAVRKRLGVYNSFPSRSAATKSRWAAFLNSRVETTHFDPAPEAPPPLTEQAEREKPSSFSVDSGNVRVMATPQELAQLLSIMCGVDRRQFTVSFE